MTVIKLKMRFFFLFLVSQSFGQNYIEYQRTFNRIDDDVLSQNYSVAIKRLDSIYSNYNFIYAKHCIKALQICVTANDSIRASKWLGKCFSQGVSIKIIKLNEITKRSLHYSTTQHVILKADSLQSVYEYSINKNLAMKIDSLFEIDQELTRKVNDGFFLFRPIHLLRWLKNNKKQFKIIDNIIDNYGYPGERLLGLKDIEKDSSAIQFYKRNGLNFYSDNRVYFILIHYFSTPRKDINDKLLQNVVNGFIPAYQYGALNDFMAKWGKKRYGDYQYYNVWHQDNELENLESINKRRFSIGLNTFEQQEINKMIYRELRKNKKANTEIILE